MTKDSAGFGVVDREPLRIRLLKLLSYVGLLLFVLGVACFALKVKQIAGSTLPPLEELFVLGLSAAALFYLMRDRATMSITLGIFVWVYCIVMFAGAISDIGGIQSTPGRRLSPNGAIALASLGLSIALLSRAGRFKIKLLLAAVCSYICAILGLVATWGHVLGIREGYAWGMGSELTLPLALWVLASGAIVGFASQMLMLSTGSGFRGAFALPAGLAMSLGTLLFAAALFSHESFEVSTALQKESDLTRRLLELSEKEMITFAQQVPLPLDKNPQARAMVLPIEVPHASVRKAIYVKDESVDPSTADLKSLASEETIKKLLKSDEVVVSSPPFAGAEDVPLVLVSVKRKQEGANSPRVLLRVAIPDLVVPALSWCRECGATLRRFDEKLVEVGNVTKSSSTPAVQQPISFLGTKGWTIEIVPGKSFAGAPGGQHPILVPLVFLVIGALACTACWLHLRVKAADTLMQEIAKSLGGSQAFREKAAEALDIIRDYVITVDSNERIMYMNRAARHMLTGDSEDEVFLADLYPTHVLAKFRKTGFVKSRGGQPWATDAVLRNRVGVEFDVDQAIIAHVDSDEKPIGYTLIAHDLRDDPPPDTSEQDTKDRWSYVLAEIFSSLAVPAWISDASRGKVLEVSRELREILSSNCDDLLHDETGWLERIAGEDQLRVRDEMVRPVGPRGQEIHYKLRVNRKEVPVRQYRVPLTFGENDSYRCLILNIVVAAEAIPKGAPHPLVPEKISAPLPTERKPASDARMLLEFITSVLGETARQIDRLLSVMILDGANRPVSELQEDLALVKERASRFSMTLTEVSDVLKCESRELTATDFEIGAAVDNVARDNLTKFPRLRVNMLHFAGVTMDRDIVDSALRSIFAFVAGWCVPESSIEVTMKADSASEAMILVVQFQRVSAEIQKGSSWFLPICQTAGGLVKPGLALAKAASGRLSGDVSVVEGADFSMTVKLTIPSGDPQLPVSGKARGQSASVDL